MRILLIERDLKDAAQILDYFESRGHQLDVVADGLAGLHLAATNLYDAVVLDWLLPRMEGLEGFYPEITDCLERTENFWSCLTRRRRILGLWRRSMYSNTSDLAASSVGYVVR